MADKEAKIELKGPNTDDSQLDVAIVEANTPIRNNTLSTQDIDDIAKKLLSGKFYLSALEFHAELVEVGRELARLKDFFSNPGNFEVQMKLDPLLSVRKTPSILTLDSIDDFARYSDDGLRETDEKVTVLEFELRKAKETIHELRESITELTADNKDKKNLLSEDIDLRDDEQINHFEIRTLNFLVNEYLLKHEYKLTSITFADELADQDLDDWEDVGLNTGQPPDVLHLLRDFSKHVVDPVKLRDKEIEDLKQEINKLTHSCSQLQKEISAGQSEIHRLTEELEKASRLKSQENFLHVHNLSRHDEDNISNKSYTSYKSENSDIKENYILVENEPQNENLGQDEDQHIFLDNSELQNTNVKEDSEKRGTDYHDEPESDKMIIIDEFNEVKKDVTCSISNSVDDVNSNIRQLSSTFLSTLLSMTQVVGESRLSKEVSKEEDNTPVQVIAESLPNIVPNVLLNKREELIPLILCAVRFHDNANVRDELLHSLFNLIKRPDKEQRKIIIDGCVTFAKYVEPVRIEAEFLPQCWEQINHKFSERRLLVAETCGNMAPYIPVSLLSSLIFSMLSQMLQEDRSEEVRRAVVKNLGIILSFVTDARKYSQAFTLLELGLNDITDEVVADTKNILLPVVGVWASEINKLQSHLIPALLNMCQRSLQSWYEASITNTEGDSNALLMAAEMKFNNYIDCLVKMVTIMFLHCLQTAPFYHDDYEASIQTPLRDMRLPAMKNPLLDIDTIVDDKDRVCFLVNQFDEAMKSSDQIWDSVEWVCNECLSKTCEMSVLTSGNSNLMAKFVCYMCTICRIFGKKFTFTKIVPYFEKLMRNTGAEFLNDVPPVCSPLLTLFLCGVLSSHQEEEEDKKLFSFVKQCLLTISTQGLTMKYLVLSVTMLCETPLYQSPLVQTLRELVVYPVAEVRSSIAQLFGVLVKCVNKDLIASQVASAIISLTNDRDISVRIAAVPALGNVIEVISDKNLLDKVSFQLQTLLDTPELQKNINLQIAIINTFTRIMPNTDHKFRDEFLIPRLKVTAEINESVEDVSDRMEVVESLIQVLSAALCCFLSKETIVSFIIPTLHLLKDDVKNVSPETLDSVLLLLKDAESKCEDDKSSTGSGVSSTSSKLFGGISSRLDKFKKKKQ